MHRGLAMPEMMSLPRLNGHRRRLSVALIYVLSLMSSSDVTQAHGPCVVIVMTVSLLFVDDNN